jgi:hypothetical protein
MKRIHEHSIDRLSRELLKDYSVEAPEGAFFAIKDDLNVQSKQRRKQYFMYIAASWLVLLSFGLGYWTRSIHSVDSVSIASNSKQQINSNLHTHNSFLVAQSSVSKSSVRNARTVNFSDNGSLLKEKETNSNNNSISTNISSIAINQPTKQPEIINAKSDTLYNKVMSHIDSLKFLYKYIAFSSGEPIIDTVTNASPKLVYNEPLLPIETSSKSSWTVGGGVAPMMGFDMFGAGQQNLTASRLKSGLVNDQPEPTLNKSITVSYATGISLKRSLGDNWNIRTGMNYNKITESNVDVSYVEIPVLTEYRLLNKALKIYFTNGFGAGLKQMEIYPLGMTGFSLLYPLNKSIDFNLEPSFKHVFGKEWTYKADYYGMMAGFSVKF